jgi:hypothetical protein
MYTVQLWLLFNENFNKTINIKEKAIYAHLLFVPEKFNAHRKKENSISVFKLCKRSTDGENKVTSPLENQAKRINFG